ncbi:MULTISPECIES: dihydropteroate synthase [Stenotrophomonas]|jgi:dihydropteroate synthase|uniref:Dihydropteroate synthase n=1 Tax=Stenotrophomonas acidaminiphila TaxID=128780 RepID=A0A0R0DQS1_9GAMM|nr:MULTISPECIES: dihydropteroate synthase [Stenotrophomonas]ALJ27873.1 dihydropteroate synthase [Stenotrophomonas acidaminiphila]KRG83781.1 dihydropteroate synthase [Stenotrophomonas acidaminiphila]QOF99887.1 dihydropteroate synthase [Stenotrophomonas sp. CW117]
MFDTSPVVDCAGRPLRLDRPRVMGIVNVTPDSFSDGGRHFSTDAAIAHALALVEQGADILDIGGESTRPGAGQVSAQQEIERVAPVIEALAARVPVPLSVDTFKPEVMRAAVAAGAGMVNDVQALRQPGALEVVAGSGAAVVLMHAVGGPHDAGVAWDSDDVAGDVQRFLAERLFAAEMAGIARNRLVVDPGYGFNKDTAQNFALLAAQEKLLALGVPLLAGLSRKRCIGEVTGRTVVAERVAGSVAAHLLAVQRGAGIVRVHDVAATVDALKVLAALDAVPAPRADRVAPPRWPDED